MDALPRRQVVDFLEKTNTGACIGYLEHLIDALGETGAEYHDKLVELYLEKARSDADASENKERLLQFLDRSNEYRAHRILGRLNDDGEWGTGDPGEEADMKKCLKLGRYCSDGWASMKRR